MEELDSFRGMKNISEISKVVSEYQVVIGATTIKIKILYYFHLNPGYQYMAIPSHSLLLSNGQPYHPLRNFASEEEALKDMLYEFGQRVGEDWGPEHWVPFD